MRDRDKGFHPSLLDVIFIILFNLIPIIGLQAKNIMDEYSTKINMYERQMPRQQSQQDGVEVPVLTVAVNDQNSQTLVLSSKTTGKEEFGSTAEVKTALAAYRPARIKLRIDKNVKTGMTQELLLDMQELGIQASLSVKRK